MSGRWVHVLAQPTIGQTQHKLGSPFGDQVRLPPAQRLEIEERPDGVFLTRFAETGEFAGDTWHQSLDEAKAQAKFEFGVDWDEIPDDG